MFTFNAVLAGAFCLLFLSAIIKRTTTVAIINTTTTAPTVPRMPAMRMEGFSVKFVAESVPMLEEEEGEEELLGSPVSPPKIVVIITVSLSITVWWVLLLLGKIAKTGALCIDLSEFEFESWK